MMLALKLIGGRILGFLKSLPWQVWLGLAIAAAIFFGVRWHNGAVKGARADGDRAGYARAGAEFVEKMRQIEAKANTIAANARKKNDEEARAIAGRADDLRVRGPGKASCPRPVPASTPRRPDAPGGQADAPRSEVPTDEWAAVPWQWFVTSAEVCDLNRAEVLAWRDWHGQLTKAKP